LFLILASRDAQLDAGARESFDRLHQEPRDGSREVSLTEEVEDILRKRADGTSEHGLGDGCERASRGKLERLQLVPPFRPASLSDRGEHHDGQGVETRSLDPNIPQVPHYSARCHASRPELIQGGRDVIRGRVGAAWRGPSSPHQSGERSPYARGERRVTHCPLPPTMLPRETSSSAYCRRFGHVRIRVAVPSALSAASMESSEWWKLNEN